VLRQFTPWENSIASCYTTITIAAATPNSQFRKAQAQLPAPIHLSAPNLPSSSSSLQFLPSPLHGELNIIPPLIKNKTVHLALHLHIRNNIPQQPRPRIPLDDHRPPLVLETYTNQRPVPVEREVPRVDTPCGTCLAVGYEAGGFVQGEGDKGVRGDGGAVGWGGVGDC